MMRDRNVLIALIFLGAIATALLLQVPDPSSGPADEEKVLPELALKDVTGLNLVSEDLTVSLRKSEPGWLLEERYGYPANFESLSALLNQLADLTIAEQKTAKPENHARLGVADTGEGAGVLIEILPQGHSLILGKRSASQGSHFRFADDPQVYLSDDPVEVELDLLHWLDAVIVDVDPEVMREVSISTKGAGFLSATWADSAGGLVVNDIPADRELRYAGIADTLGRLLINLQFLDVEPYQDGFFIDPSILKVVLDDGQVLEVKTVRSGEEYWLYLDREQNRDWQYRISASTYSDLNKTMEDLLKPVEDDS